MFADIWSLLRNATVFDILDIVLVAVLIYYALLLIRDTRAYQAAIGLGVKRDGVFGVVIAVAVFHVDGAFRRTQSLHGRLCLLA